MTATPADKLAEWLEKEGLPLIHSFNREFTARRGEAALAAYRQSQQAQGERLPKGMTLKDVWEVVRWLESREIRVGTGAFETNKRRAFTYAALKRAQGEPEREFAKTCCSPCTGDGEEGEDYPQFQDVRTIVNDQFLETGPTDTFDSVRIGVIRQLETLWSCLPQKGECLLHGVTLADVWSMVEALYTTLLSDRLEHGPHEGQCFFSQEQQATYAALKKAVEKQKGGKG